MTKKKSSTSCTLIDARNVFKKNTKDIFCVKFVDADQIQMRFTIVFHVILLKDAPRVNIADFFRYVAVAAFSTLFQCAEDANERYSISAATTNTVFL